LAAQGYSRFTLREYESIADRLCAAVETGALREGDLNSSSCSTGEQIKLNIFQRRRRFDSKPSMGPSEREGGEST
jgi:hypothetical protein